MLIVVMVQIKQFLPAPKYASNLLGYKFPWSSRGVPPALLNDAPYISSHRTLSITSSRLMVAAQQYFVSPVFAR
jgi:hypothetical protein